MMVFSTGGFHLENQISATQLAAKQHNDFDFAPIAHWQYIKIALTGTIWEIM